MKSLAITRYRMNKKRMKSEGKAIVVEQGKKFGLRRRPPSFFLDPARIAMVFLIQVYS
jgi:hypothetical protein